MTPKAAAAIADYVKGIPIKVITSTRNISTSYLYDVLDKHNVERRRPVSWLTEAQRRNIVKDRRDGMSIPGLRRKYRRSYHTIVRALGALSSVTGPRWRWSGCKPGISTRELGDGGS